jgi:hypothetical protein
MLSPLGLAAIPIRYRMHDIETRDWLPPLIVPESEAALSGVLP